MVEGSTRRLPTWLAVVDEDKKTNEKKKKKKKKTTTVEEKKLEAELEENPNLPRNSLSLAKNETQRTKNYVLQHKADDSLSRSGGKKRKAQNAVFGIHGEIHNPSTSDDHILDDNGNVLTVEDLVSIAQEYVKDNKESEQNLPLSGICESSARIDLEGSRKQQLPSGETRASFGSTVNLTSEQSFISFSRTGDPAQDMLDLFLGPLLKKPQENEKRTGFGSKDLDMAYELEKQCQNDSSEEMIPVTKKKSSLKYKVHSILD